jgi:bifunctional non-homologous end joining protein LigD
MGLEEYNKKRNFNSTPEPVGILPEEEPLRFVIQEHHATKHHFDLRLEMDGILKSWAIPKGLILKPGEKHLAVHTEDHPLAYLFFEGVIPPENYGAGKMQIWDSGHYYIAPGLSKSDNQSLALQGLKAGSLSFYLEGSKTKGKFTLVHLQNQQNQWLLLYSGKQKTEKEQPQPQTTLPVISPMLAKIHDQPFDNENWIFELKWDGYRAIANIAQNQIFLYSRNANSFNEKYPLIVDCLHKIRHEAILDGEIVVLNNDGIPDFQALQQYDQNPHDHLYYYVFDLLWLEGNNLMDLPLMERKKLLKQLLTDNPLAQIRYSDHIQTQGTALFDKAIHSKLEGIIAKKADSSYLQGTRSGDWLKIKSRYRQEAIICGFTEGKGSRNHFGALLLGAYQNNTLHYIGHCGTGFTEKSLSELRKKLDPLVIPSPLFEEKINTNTPSTWVVPELICEVAFAGWTNDHQMRHPVFLGLREDKHPLEVYDDIPNNDDIQPETSSSERNQTSIDNKKVTITHPSKTYWPDQGFTKEDLIQYYQSIAAIILPYLKDRPLNLNRHPNGIQGHSFYQKDITQKTPSWMHTFPIISEEDKEIHYALCQNKPSLAYLNNLGCIEFHPWNATITQLDYPDYCIIDLDPGQNTFDQVIEVALQVHDILEKAQIPSYCKTSGSRGMHIFIPLGKKYTHDQSKDFAHIICQITHEHLPALTSLARSPKLRTNKIYLDFLQNKKGQSIACPYSVRARSGATVSTPLLWEEVKPGLSPADFTILNTPKRLKQKGDIFQKVLGQGINIMKSLRQLGA